ncbi:MAG: hypothetical protein C0483_02430 [Pirellula sp.]|nr:hypothetical protein [Pirellula sp.]
MKSWVYRMVVLATLPAVGMFTMTAGFAKVVAAEAPDVYVQKLMKDAGAGNGSALWNALPESYQDDVHDVIGEFGEKMDADLWNSVFKTAGKLVKVLKDKKEFILGSALTASMPAEQKDEMKKHWDAAVTSLDTLVSSDIKTLDGVKDLDVGEYLKGTGDKLISDLVAAANSNPDAAEGMEKFKKAKVTLVSQEGDEATLKLETEGEEPKEEKFTQVEGKWLPSKMVEEWDDNIEKAMKGLEQLKIPPEQKAQVMQLTALADGMLDNLAAAKDQASFDAALQGILAFLPMFGGGGGPPGAAAPPAP